MWKQKFYSILIMLYESQKNKWNLWKNNLWFEKW